MLPSIDTTYYIDKTVVPTNMKWLDYALIAIDLTRLNKSAAVPGLNRDDAGEQPIPFSVGSRAGTHRSAA